MPDRDPIVFDERGLAPCIVQDSRTGEVLMLAWVNEEALGLTRESGQMHFYSRSRAELWRKGETSGNVMKVVQVRYDCDADAVLALVEPAGPACHTGERSCFYRELGGAASSEADAPRAEGEPHPLPFEALPVLERTLRSRQAERPEGSYTVELLDDTPLIGEKVREEAEEVTRAAREESDERVAEEAADVLYHLSVLLRSREIDLEQAYGVLNERRA
jgi:phosphoribosyl-ATP pyrophosphohydrolase/phosphoribosyl-AMP cyclohydrolase